MARISLMTTQNDRYKLKWKKNLKAVGDNANWIEQNMVAIAKELKKSQPDTGYLRSKVKNIGEWLDEIDLANRRASSSRLKKVM
jgi:hypothetical protein